MTIVYTSKKRTETSSEGVSGFLTLSGQKRRERNKVNEEINRLFTKKKGR